MDFSEPCCLVSGPSDMWSGTIADSVSLPPESVTESCPTLLSSAMSKHSSVLDVRSFIEGLRTSSPGASPAKTFHAPGGAEGLKGKDRDSGKQWHKSFASFDPDTHSWKIPQCSLLGGLEPFSETWPRWGLMHNGECFQPPMSAEISCVKGSLLPAPLKSMGVSFLGGPIRTDETWSNTGRLDHRLIGIWKNWTGRENNGRLKEKIVCHPTFAEWVMGLPMNWTALEKLEICSVRKWLQQHGKC